MSKAKANRVAAGLPAEKTKSAYDWPAALAALEAKRSSAISRADKPLIEACNDLIERWNGGENNGDLYAAMMA